MALPKQENFASLAQSADLNSVTGWTLGIGSLGGPTGGGSVTSFTTGDSVYWWSGDTFGNNQYAQIVCGTAPDATGFIGVALRATSDHCYYCMCSPGASGDTTGYIGTLTSTLGTDTEIRHFARPAAGVLLRLEVSGDTFTLKGNGSIIQTQPAAGGSFTDTFTDTTIQTGGAAGICAYGNVSGALTGDDWEGGNVSGSGLTINPTIGTVTLTGNSSPMDYTMTPRTA